jgi:alpha-D-ribose 1-methylphosphonate 5-triphosphate synthase subunit PhnL
MDQPLLAVRQLSKSFTLHLIDGRTIAPLQNLSLDVGACRHFLIHGRSGIGKTSILKCIYRSYRADSGTILFDSALYGPIDLVSVDDSTMLQIREHEIGYCSQFLRVLPRVSALDTICEPLYRQGMDREQAQQIGVEWLQRLEIRRHLWQAGPATFSGGEQQRINLGRAFIAAPRLLLLDEPTASLDGASKQIVVELIRDAQRSGTTIISVSHDIAVLGAAADQQLAL